MLVANFVAFIAVVLYLVSIGGFIIFGRSPFLAGVVSLLICCVPLKLGMVTYSSMFLMFMLAVPSVILIVVGGGIEAVRLVRRR